MSRITDFARDECGVDLSPVQAEMLTSFTEGDYRVAVWQCGRRAGKSLLTDILSLYDVVIRGELAQYLRPGELRISGIIAPRTDQAQTHIRNLRSMVARSELLSSMLVSETTESLVFANDAAIRVYPSSARSLRGDPWSSAIADELGHMVDSENNQGGEQVLTAVRPSLAQFSKSGWLLAVSTPRWRAGAFYRLCQEGKEGRPGYHYRHYDSATMNPRLDKDFLEEERRLDPLGFEREYRAEFLDISGSFLPSEAILAAFRDEELDYEPEFHYVAAIDLGLAVDSTALAIAHAEIDDAGRRWVVVDRIETWVRPGFQEVIGEIAAWCRRFGISTVISDQYAPQATKEALARQGLDFQLRSWTSDSKLQAFSRLKTSLMVQSIELPPNDTLRQELLGLEARPLPSGAVRIAAAGSGHDDTATALAAVVNELTRPTDLTAEPLVVAGTYRGFP